MHRTSVAASACPDGVRAVRTPPTLMSRIWTPNPARNSVAKSIAITASGGPVITGMRISGTGKIRTRFR